MGLEQRIQERHQQLPEFWRKSFQKREPRPEPRIPGLSWFASGQEEVRGCFQELGDVREHVHSRTIGPALELADLAASRPEPRRELALAPAFRAPEMGDAVPETFRRLGFRGNLLLLLSGRLL